MDFWIVLGQLGAGGVGIAALVILFKVVTMFVEEVRISRENRESDSKETREILKDLTEAIRHLTHPIEYNNGSGSPPPGKKTSSSRRGKSH